MRKNKPITDDRLPRIFISYARADGEEFARDLFKTIMRRARLRVWRDREGMRGGEDWWNQIDAVLDAVEYMVLVLTPGVFESETCRREWDLAREKGVCIYPVIASDKLDWQKMPPWLSRGHCYDLKFQEPTFLSDLTVRCQRIRVPFMADKLPENFVSRPGISGELIKKLTQSDPNASGPVTVALRGGGGFGKTMLAVEVCHDSRTRYVFHQGVLWVSLREAPIEDLARRVEDLVFELSGERPGLLDATQTSHRLRDLLRDRKVLIVIDDVWRESDAAPFLVGGPGCAHLITTRLREVLPEGCVEITVNEMEQAEALAMLGHSIPQDESSQDLSRLGDRLGRWPILLNLVNRVLADRIHRRKQQTADAIQYAHTKLDHYGLTAFDRNNSEARAAAVEKTVAVSLGLLSEGDDLPDSDPVARFEELAVFPRSRDIPVAAVSRLWRHNDAFQTTELCERLYDYSLLQRFDLDDQTVRLHDVMSAYLRRRTQEKLKAFNVQLIESYRASCGNKWERLANDRYIHDHLVAHLYTAGFYEELFGLIGPTWRAAQQSRTGSDRAFAADVDFAGRTAIDATNWAQLLRLYFLRSVVFSGASRVSDESLGGLVWLDRSDEARDKAALFSDAAARTRAYISVATALAARKAPRADEVFVNAFQSAAAIRSGRARCKSFHLLALTLLNCGRRDEALKAAKQCAAAAEQTEYSGFRERVLASDLMLLLGDKTAAAELLKQSAEEMIKKGERTYEWVDTRLAMADPLRRAGMEKLADEILVPAWEVFERGPEVRQEDGTILRDFSFTLDLIESLARLGKVELALNYNKSSYRPPDVSVRCTIGRVLQERGEHDEATKHFEAAISLMKRLPTRTYWETPSYVGWNRPAPSTMMIEVLLEFGEVPTAEKLALSLDDPDLASEALGLVGKEAAQAGREAEAKRFLEQSFERATPKHALDQTPLLLWRATMLRTLPASDLVDRVKSWIAEYEHYQAPFKEFCEFANALIRHDAALAIEVFQTCESRTSRGDDFPLAMVEFASALNDAGHADAVDWARKAVDALPATIESEDSAPPILNVLSRASTVLALHDKERAGEVIDRVVHFFDMREGKSRSSVEFEVWRRVLLALITIGRAREVIPISERIDLWSPDGVRRKVAMMQELAGALSETEPDLAREANLVAARTALTVGILIPESEEAQPLPAGGPVFTGLLDEARAEADRIRKGFYPTGIMNPAMEALLVRAQAAESLAEIEPESAAALVDSVLKLLGPVVRSGMILPVSRGEVFGQQHVVSGVVEQILTCCKVAFDREDIQELVDVTLSWAIANAEAYSGSPSSCVRIYMAGARTFHEFGYGGYAFPLFVRALYTLSTGASDDVLKLIGENLDLLAIIEEDESLQRGIKLIDREIGNN